MNGIIGIVAALFVVAWGRSESGGSRQRATATEEWTLPREEASGLALRTQGGNIRSDAEARAFLEEMRVERRREGDRWVVEAHWPQPRPRGIDGAYINFEIQVPQGMRLEAESRGGNLEVSGVGQPHLHTGGGNIRVMASSGPFELDTGGGNIELHQAQHAVRAHTGGGNIQVEGDAGPVDAHTGSGNIAIRRAESPVKAVTGAGNVAVEIPRVSGAAEVEMGTGAGNLELRLPKDVSARVEAKTNLGHVQRVPAAGGHSHRGHNHLQAVLGDGHGSVHLRTGTGNIQIRLTAMP